MIKYQMVMTNYKIKIPEKRSRVFKSDPFDLSTGDTVIIKGIQDDKVNIEIVRGIDDRELNHEKEAR